MNYEALFARHRDRTVRMGLVGAGQFGATLIAQARAIPQLEIPIVCDRDVEAARSACRAAGFRQDEIEICDDAATIELAVSGEKLAVVPDAVLLLDMPLDCIVEATGNPEAGAATAAAIAHGKHVVMASKEAESVVGPLLAAHARAAGLVYTAVEGDQPSLLIGLVSWARLLGLEIICAGKSSEYDFVYDPAQDTVSWKDISVAVPDFAGLWTLPEDGVAAAIAERASMLREIPQRTVPDLCEMGVVANATGLPPDTPDFHVPVARAVEVPQVLCPSADGGILDREGVIDVFNCLRRPDEQSFAGGVFVVVRLPDRQTWSVLKGKGIPVSRRGDYALLYNPSHLLGVEAPVSILSACLLGLPTGGLEPRPVVDLVARTSCDWRAGEALAITDHHHHEAAGLEPLLVDAAPAVEGNPLPYYMATGETLTRNVAKGSVIAADMVAAPTDSGLWALRAEQDEHFDL